MKILLYLHHPAHFHLFKNLLQLLRKNNILVTVIATKKDVLTDLLEENEVPYLNILPNGRHDKKINIALALLLQDYRLFKLCIIHKPDLLLGTSTEITHIGKLLKIPSLFVNEDDIDVIPLVGRFAYPFADYIITPESCRVGKYEKKQIKYNSYHELAYLHPKYFIPDQTIASSIVDVSKPYFLLRLAKLTAHHDTKISGINNDFARRIINILSPYGNIYITAEREIIPQFEPYRIKASPGKIHHIMAFSSLFIGDSQTMAAEAAVLGVPFLRFNDFVDRISYLKELEHKYGLGFGFKTDQSESLFSKLKEIAPYLNTLKNENSQKVEKLLNEKIDLNLFLYDFVMKKLKESIK